MSERNIEIARRIVEGFNEDGADLNRALEPTWAEDEAIHPDIELVPFRAALEGTVYRPPNAPQQFWDGSRASWRTLRLEIEEMRDEDPDHVLATGKLHGTARETGLEVAAPVAIVVTFREGSIIGIASHETEARALEAIRADERRS